MNTLTSFLLLLRYLSFFYGLQVKFGKKAKRSNVPEETRFFLLHLSLMREYLELEFSSLKKALQDKFAFNIENIIDDWVRFLARTMNMDLDTFLYFQILMGFLVGNDFIPNLPNLHISEGSLPLLYDVYKQVLPTLDGRLFKIRNFITICL